MVELDNSFSTGKPAGYNLDAVLDLDRVIPCVAGGKVLERSSSDLAKAEIKVKMGAMSMTFKGTVEVASKDAGSAVLRIKSKDTGGSGYANAGVRLGVGDAGATIPTQARTTGKGASMGEGVGATVLDGLINDSTTKLA